MTLEAQIFDMTKRARAASRRLACLDGAERRAILLAMAAALEASRESIGAANEKDLAAAEENGLSRAMVDRLRLTPARMNGMIAGVRKVAGFENPLGAVLARHEHENGLLIEKRRVPIGVITIIYESRPNVTADAGVLCIMAGNAVILRGGKEARHSNRAIAEALRAGGLSAGMPADALQLVASVDRDAVRLLAQATGRVDLIIPRGGEGLIRAVDELARVPVIKHYKGVCHVYVDAAADLDMALAITENAKCQRPGVCNALESLLIHESVAAQFLPRLGELLAAVELRGDARSRSLLPRALVATEADWDAEYLDLILALRVVSGLDEALDHIARFGSGHSEAIITSDPEAQQRFVDEVDAAAVYVNASTRFTDGGEFGMGAEIGISTDKLHARGPMGLVELTTYKYVCLGSGQIRH